MSRVLLKADFFWQRYPTTPCMYLLSALLTTFCMYVHPMTDEDYIEQQETERHAHDEQVWLWTEHEWGVGLNY